MISWALHCRLIQGKLRLKPQKLTLPEQNGFSWILLTGTLSMDHLAKRPRVFSVKCTVQRKTLVSPNTSTVSFSKVGCGKWDSMPVTEKGKKAVNLGGTGTRDLPSTWRVVKALVKQFLSVLLTVQVRMDLSSKCSGCLIEMQWSRPCGHS